MNLFRLAAIAAIGMIFAVTNVNAAAPPKPGGFLDDVFNAVGKPIEAVFKAGTCALRGQAEETRPACGAKPKIVAAPAQKKVTPPAKKKVVMKKKRAPTKKKATKPAVKKS